MELTKATIEHAEYIGKIHSLAWKQAYEGIFPEEYLQNDTAEKRRMEFLDSLIDPSIQYYLIQHEESTIGIVKLNVNDAICEIQSIYLLKEYCNLGIGSDVIKYIVQTWRYHIIMLWTLEENYKARRFYEKNHFVQTSETRIIPRGQKYKQVQYVYTI